MSIAIVRELEEELDREKVKSIGDGSESGYDIRIKHALIFHEADIRYFAAHAKRYTTQEPSARVYYRSGRWQEFAIDELLDADEIGDEPIKQIGILAGDKELGRSFVLFVDVETSTMVEIEGESALARRLHSRVMNRLGKMRPFYSFLAHDEYIMFCAIAAVATFILSMTQEWRWAGVTAIAAVLFAAPVWKFLFPKVALGFAGGDRHLRRAESWRALAYSLLGSSIVFPAIWALISA